MSTVRTICTRALRRIGVVSVVDSPSAEDAAAALAHFNEMTYGWAADGVDVLQQADWTLDDEFVFWVPPLDIDADTIAVLSYRGTWDATANSPSLTSSSGTEGYVYKVATAGSTTLDDVTSWALNDYAVYGGSEWLKGISSRRFDGGITAMLAMRCAAEFGTEVPADTAILARQTWSLMLPYYSKPPLATFDLALRDIPSRGGMSFDEELQ
jgi:hypothetical protein